MQWWNDFVDWLFSDDGWRFLSTVILPFVAILVAGLIAAAIGRGSTKRVLSLNERQQRAAAVTAMIGSARRAAVWNTLSDSEQRHADYSALEADVRLRLLSVTGANLATDWCAHEITMMKKNAVSFSFQAEQSLLEFRNRLIEWHERPSRAKKLFKNDLDSWAYDTSVADQELVSQQQAWAAQQSAVQPEPASRRDLHSADATADAPAPAAPTAPAVVRQPFAPASRPVVPPATAPATAPVPAGAQGPTAAHDDDGSRNSGASEVDEDTDSGEAEFPPVSVSHVRERISPTPVANDELR
ncbi:hypothetical protein GCM10027052_11700 [Parafrigoribacterium mesophilum]|uniref:hypothetical protein n=1 Tax=Parafrigoribacterium mesophilum TaxID=433646 RepID=UPI0031FBBF78